MFSRTVVFNHFYIRDPSEYLMKVMYACIKHCILNQGVHRPVGPLFQGIHYVCLVISSRHTVSHIAIFLR